MLRIAAVALVVAVAALLGWAATRPDILHVERSTVVRAPRERIVPLIDDFRAWRAWSPYERKGPDMQRTLGGAERGPGSTYAGSGDRNIGSGRMEILESSPERVRIQLDFFTPFEAHNVAEFTLAPAGDATRVTWAMRGPNRFVGKLMSLFFDMDAMIGRDFESGLAELKSIAES